MPDPVINKTIVTGDDNDMFTLTIKAYITDYGDDYYNYIYWYVSCDKPYNNKPFTVHPFRFVNDDVNEDNCIWEIVVDNEIMRKTIEALSMSDEDLEDICGGKHPIEYRARLIKILSDMWD